MSESLRSQTSFNSVREDTTPSGHSFAFSRATIDALESYAVDTAFREAIMNGDVDTVVQFMAKGEALPAFHKTISVGDLVKFTQTYGAETAMEMVRQLRDGGLLRQAIERDLRTRARVREQIGRTAVSSVEFLDPPNE